MLMASTGERQGKMRQTLPLADLSDAGIFISTQLLVVIGASRCDFTGPINLLGEDESHQLMREN